MKSIAFVLPLLFLSSAAMAESPAANVHPVLPADASAAPATQPAADKPETLLGSRGFIRHSGWYLGPSFGTTTFDGRFGYAPGIRGAWVINRQFGLGLALTGFERPSSSGGANRRIEGGYGGLLVQYIVASDRLVHGYIDTTIGLGAVCPSSMSDRSDCTPELSRFFMLEPTANVQINVASFMRVDVGAGYRLAAAYSDAPLSSGDLSGFVARTNLVFGQF